MVTYVEIYTNKCPNICTNLCIEAVLTCDASGSKTIMEETKQKKKMASAIAKLKLLLLYKDHNNLFRVNLNLSKINFQL